MTLLKKIIIAGLSLLFLPLATIAAPKAELWDVWNKSGSKASIDHVPWQSFLDKYLVEPATGPALVKYSQVTKQSKAMLDSYIEKLSQTDILSFTRDEQFAFWVNLYNAATVQLILDKYPVESITKIKAGFFSFGPWDMELLKVRGIKLTLNDIEHRILRPIWQDSRIHYVVNCASFSCPSLSAKAMTAENMESELEAAARKYLLDKRALKINGGGMTLSSIYDWYRVDFGDDEAFARHILKYRPDLGEAQIRGLLSDVDYEYDWSLNEAK